VKARPRFVELRHVLQEEEGGVETVITALGYLTRKTRSAKLKTELGYFRNNRERMQYAQLAARGFPIGSGVVEAACKTLVAQRLKRNPSVTGVLARAGVGWYPGRLLYGAARAT
jgi:hypothetical protein